LNCGANLRKEATGATIASVSTLPEESGLIEHFTSGFYLFTITSAADKSTGKCNPYLSSEPK
jgi:hypothetical protein